MIIIACVERYVLFTRLRVAVTITESTLDAACGASITRRDASMVYMLRNLIEDAVSDATSDFSSVSKLKLQRFRNFGTGFPVAHSRNRNRNRNRFHFDIL